MRRSQGQAKKTAGKLGMGLSQKHRQGRCTVLELDANGLVLAFHKKPVKRSVSATLILGLYTPDELHDGDLSVCQIKRTELDCTSWFSDFAMVRCERCRRQSGGEAQLEITTRHKLGSLSPWHVSRAQHIHQPTALDPHTPLPCDDGRRPSLQPLQRHR